MLSWNAASICLIGLSLLVFLIGSVLQVDKCEYLLWTDTVAAVCAAAGMLCAIFSIVISARRDG